MLILPLRTPHSQRKSSVLLGSCILLLASALVLWPTVWWQARQASHQYDEASPSTSAVEAGMAPSIASDAQSRSSDAVLGFLATKANEMGVIWVSVQVEDAMHTHDVRRLDAWKAQISLRGSYAAVKRWLREAVGRYPNLVMQTARWARPGGGVPTVPGAADALEVQLQLVWLQRPSVQHPSAVGEVASGQASK